MPEGNGKGFLHQALVADVESVRTHPQYEVWLNYALSTNERGQNVVDTLLKLSPSLAGKRLLDVGCGFGGTCIAAAGAGAFSVGLDLDDRLLVLAELNKKDHPGVRTEFLRLDIMEWEQLKHLGRFDVITCDNVIEHVEIPERLVLNLRKLLAKGGLIYLTIPNAFSTGQVRKDCHYGLFGISLLDPWDATLYVRHSLLHASYDVSFYYAFEQYHDLFSKNGFRTKLLNPYSAAHDDVLKIQEEFQRLRSEAQGLEESDKVPAVLKDKLPWALDKYFKRVQADFDLYDHMPSGAEKDTFANRLIRDYDTELWYVVLSDPEEAETSIMEKLLSLMRRF